MRLNQIRDFLAISEAGSLRAAARMVGVSQPAMTKSVQQLEKELRAQLLHRTTNGAVPTPAGKAFLSRARVIQAELRKAEDDIAQLRGERGGAVAIGASPTAGVLVMPEALRRLQRRRPRCSVHLVEGVWSTLQPLVRNGTLDLALVLKAPDAKLDPSLRFRPLYRAQMIIAGCRGHPLRGARSLQELGTASWLMFGPPGDSGLLAKYFTTAGLPAPSVTVQCESYATTVALLATTHMVGLMVPLLLSERYAHGVLQQISVGEPPPTVTFGVLSRADAPLTPASDAMAQAVAEAARRLSG